METHANLERIQHHQDSTPEDIRKASSTYFAARANRFKAERDFLTWQVEERSLLYYDEAKDIAGRPHEAAKNMLSTAAKALAPRCVGQSARAIENVIGDFIDRLTETLRQSL